MIRTVGITRFFHIRQIGNTKMRSLIFMLIVGCMFNANAKDITESIVGNEHPVCGDVMYASKNWEYYEDVYGAEYKKVARQSYVYALMASNAYEDFENKKPDFKISGWEQVGPKRTTRKGMGAHIYRSTAGPQTVAIVFEGTKQGRDWFFGNLNFFWKGQYRDAEVLIKEIAAQYPKAKLVTAGHSLGGGLAIHAALHNGKVDAYAFNTSPRIFNSDDYDATNTSITLISENDDVLEKLRKKWKSFDTLEISGPYNKFDFLDLKTNNNDRIGEHSIYFIARGLLIVAAADGDEQARGWIRDNLRQENVKKCRK